MQQVKSAKLLDLLSGRRSGRRRSRSRSRRVSNTRTTRTSMTGRGGAARFCRTIPGTCSHMNISLTREHVCTVHTLEQAFQKSISTTVLCSAATEKVKIEKTRHHPKNFLLPKCKTSTGREGGFPGGAPRPRITNKRERECCPSTSHTNVFICVSIVKSERKDPHEETSG
jgi:hypothetical protein